MSTGASMVVGVVEVFADVGMFLSGVVLRAGAIEVTLKFVVCSSVGGLHQVRVIPATAL